MPTPKPNRDRLEEELAKALAKILRLRRGRLFDELGDPPSLENLTEELWQELGDELAAELRPFLERTFVEQARNVMNQTPLGVDWTLINKRAADWARSYTFDLVRGIQQTDQTALRDAIARYFEDGQTIGDLRGQLEQIYSPTRAEMIAVTEVTRAAARGEDALVNELAGQGVEMVTTWNTNNDEIVENCPICAPMNGREADGRRNGEPYWIHPESGEEITIPGHPRCRCWENNELPNAKD